MNESIATSALLLQKLEECHSTLRSSETREEVASIFDLFREQFREVIQQDALSIEADGMAIFCQKIDTLIERQLEELGQGGYSAEVLHMVRQAIDNARRRVRQELETGCSNTDDRQQASWHEWDPHTYLETFFAEAGPDTHETLKFIRRELRQFIDQPVEKLLDFGSGPTVVVSLAASPYAKEIHLADYLPSNLAEAQKWLDSDPDAFDWDPCIADILKIEGTDATSQNIRQRACELRAKARTLLCDAALEHPLIGSNETYPLVLSIFCADSATSSRDTWRKYMKNIISLVAPQGQILIAALRNCTSYHVGDRVFPSPNINEKDLEAIFVEEGFSRDDLKIEICEVPECAQEGFKSIMFAHVSNKR